MVDILGAIGFLLFIGLLIHGVNSNLKPEEPLETKFSNSYCDNHGGIERWGVPQSLPVNTMIFCKDHSVGWYN